MQLQFITFRPVVGFPGYEVGTDGSIWTCLEMQRRSDGTLVGVLGKKWKPLIPWINDKGDGNRLNNNLWNLRWTTHTENMADKKLHGTYVCGENQNGAKLTEETVRAIRRDYRRLVVTQKQLAKRYGIGRRHVGDIVNRICWKDLRD